jgi:activating signal cointegrator 1
VKVKAISLWEPWASAIRLRLKVFETRSWPTSYRGPLLVCGAKCFTRDQDRFLETWDVQQAFQSAGLALPVTRGQMLLGKAACLVDLVACHRIRPDMEPAPMEALFGDWTPGRYAWQCANVRAITSFPVRGAQGLFEVEIPDNLLTKGTT